jgi:hypothetical protein
MENISFEEFLAQKKINAELFSAHNKSLYDAWKRDFEQLNLESFVMQKKFSINNIRRQYLVVKPT